jgi:hypothetical protein
MGQYAAGSGVAQDANNPWGNIGNIVMGTIPYFMG